MNALITTLLRTAIHPGPSQPEPDLPGPLGRLLWEAQSLALLGARFYLANVFFSSGLTKLRDWSSTLALFQDIYNVPVLPPVLAAYMGTAGELVLPVLLVAGLAGRFAGAGLFVVNLMAALSLSADDFSPAAQWQHTTWGLLALALVLCGAGRWSIDRYSFGRITRSM
ncbi:DoxX family protein [Roseateles paludis]|jgi:putative oxidoreductase|uniref:DoxX family protein n=1 Tax=Roseateles paludis TaxID=3145238 RepID=A0ABV0G7Z0_9BURK